MTSFVEEEEEEEEEEKEEEDPKLHLEAQKTE